MPWSEIRQIPGETWGAAIGGLIFILAAIGRFAGMRGPARRSDITELTKQLTQQGERMAVLETEIRALHRDREEARESRQAIHAQIDKLSREVGEQRTLCGAHTKPANRN